MIDQTQQNWDEVAKRIARCEGPVAFSWAATTVDGKWQPIVLTVRAATTTKDRFERYPTLWLSTEQVTPRVAAARFRRGSTKARRKPDLTFGPLPGQASVYWHTTETTATHLVRPSWPTFVADFHPTFNAFGGFSRWDPLTAPDRPFYANALAAVAELVHGIPPGALGNDLTPLVRVQLPDRRARFGAISFEDSATVVSVDEGWPASSMNFIARATWREDPGDATWRSADASGEAGVVRIPTEVVPAEMWMALVDPRGRVLDRRGWGPESVNRPQDRALSPEAVERWITEGESTTLECKVELEAESARRGFAETVAAFANGEGGHILVGVTKAYEVAGCNDPAMGDRLTNIIDDLVQEPPDIRVDRVHVRERDIVVVSVTASSVDRKPHLVRGRPYVRANTRTRRAFPSEVRRMTQPVPADRRFPSLGL